MLKIRDAILLLRPKQWAKNTFVFLPIFFSGHLFDPEYLNPSILAFISFCLISSSIYCYNDIHDAPNDRLHPVKKNRPIASNRVSPAEAYVLMSLLMGLSVIPLPLLPPPTINSLSCVLIGYFILNIFYCLRLKHIAIVDVFIIAIGFVLRLFAGSSSTGIELSKWIVLMTFLLALFLAFAKRRDDVVSYENTGILTRRNINKYNLQFMNQSLTVIAAVVLVSYIMYTVSPEVEARFSSNMVYLTSIFVLAGIIRYLQISIVDLKSGSPTKVLYSDKFIQICIGLWVLSFLCLLY